MSSTGKIIGALVLYGGGAYGLSKLLQESKDTDQGKAQEDPAQNNEAEKESDKQDKE